jgi:hypothetical protein
MKRDQYLAELREISSQNGGMLRPPDVIEFAKNPKTALHGCFTWDDTEAAHAWRLQQARQVIRVAVTVLPGEDPLKYRAFVSLKDDRYNDQGYRAMVDVMSDGHLRTTVLAEAMMEMQTFMSKYEGLKELAGVFEAMANVVKKPPRKKVAKYRRPEPTAHL